MMAKGLGALMVIASAILAGRFLAEPYRQRVRGLSDWARFLERLKVELTFRQRPLVEAFEQSAGTGSLKAAAANLRAVLARSGSLEEASKTAVGTDPRLGPEERTVLTALIPPLATAPTRWQGESLDNAAREINRILNGLRDECTKKARMVETLATLAGVTAVLMLL